MKIMGVQGIQDLSVTPPFFNTVKDHPECFPAIRREYDLFIDPADSEGIGIVNPLFLLFGTDPLALGCFFINFAHFIGRQKFLNGNIDHIIKIVHFSAGHIHDGDPFFRQFVGNETIQKTVVR